MMDKPASSVLPTDGPGPPVSSRKGPVTHHKPATADSPPSPGGGPPVIDIPVIEGPVWVAWREGTLTRAKELEALCLVALSVA